MRGRATDSRRRDSINLSVNVKMISDLSGTTSLFFLTAVCSSQFDTRKNPSNKHIDCNLAAVVTNTQNKCLQIKKLDWLESLDGLFHCQANEVVVVVCSLCVSFDFEAIRWFWPHCRRRMNAFVWIEIWGNWNWRKMYNKLYNCTRAHPHAHYSHKYWLRNARTARNKKHCRWYDMDMILTVNFFEL